MIVVDRGVRVVVLARQLPEFPHRLEGVLEAKRIIGAQGDEVKEFFTEYKRLCDMFGLPWAQSAEDWVHVRRLLGHYELDSLKKSAVEFINDNGETLRGYHHHMRLFAAWMKAP